MTSKDLKERLLPSGSKSKRSNYSKDLVNDNGGGEYKAVSLTMQQHSINNDGTYAEDVAIGLSTSPLSTEYRPDQPLMRQGTEDDDEDAMIVTQSTAISIQDGPQPTNMNVISALRHKATSKQTRARVDNVFLYRSIPKVSDMWMDYQTSAVALLHIGFSILTIILIVIGYVLQIAVVWKYGTFLCLVTNIFGVIHAMYSGSITNKVARLDAALQNFAMIIQKFAKAINIQEAYLNSVKHILDFLDHYTLLIETNHPEMEQIVNSAEVSPNINYKELLKEYYLFVEKLKHQTIAQHKKWLLTFYAQYKLLDNRFGITKHEYFNFVHKLPNKPRTFFQSLTGIETRFKQLITSDPLNLPPPSNKKKQKKKAEEEQQEAEEKDIEAGPAFSRKPSIGVDMNAYRSTSALSSQLGEDTVLLYQDMQDLVYKVLEDIGSENKRLQHELAEKMLSFERAHDAASKAEMDADEKEEEEEKQAVSPHQQYHLPVVSPMEVTPEPQGYILSKRMSVSLARDAPQIRMKRVSSNMKATSSGSMLQSKSANAAVSVPLYERDDDDPSYRQKRYGDDNESDDDVYNVRSADEEKHRSNTLPLHKSVSTVNVEPNEYRKQRTLSYDDDFVNKIIGDLHGDDLNELYDYSHSHKL